MRKIIIENKTHRVSFPIEQVEDQMREYYGDELEGSHLDIKEIMDWISNDTDLSSLKDVKIEELGTSSDEDIFDEVVAEYTNSYIV